MITTNRKTVGDCMACPQDANTHKSLAAVEGLRPGSRIPQGLCYPCYDKAGDENAVSDGHMTCLAFFDRWGTHSEYCDGSDRVAPAVDPAYTVVLTKSQMERVLLALWMPGHDLDEQDVAILTAMNTGTPVVA